MADISKIKLPSGNTYNIKDAVARDMIAGGVSFNIGWDGNSQPDVSNIPAGVTVEYQGQTYTGTKTASTAEPGQFYLVKSGEGLNKYDEYIVVKSGTDQDPVYSWEKMGTQEVDLSGLGDLAYQDSVTLNKGNGTSVPLAYKAAASAVTFSGGTTDTVLGSDATFTTTVTPSTTNIKATASGTAVGANGTAAAITGFGAHSTETFVKSVTADTTKKLVTTTVPNVTGNTDVTIPNVTSNTNKTLEFSLGSGNDAETLIISGSGFSANSNTYTASAVTLGTALSASKVTLGTAKTVATGAATTSGTGAAVVTNVTIGDSASAITALGTPTTSNCLTGVKVTTQPTVSLATGATAGTGVISVATGISSASTTTNNKDQVTAVTSVGTGTAAAQTITADNTGQTVKVARYDDLSVTVS